MKIKYEFANETIEIEVSDDWGEIVLELNRLEYNINHRETRRHESLDTGLDLSEWLLSDKYEPGNMLGEQESIDEIKNKLSHLTKTQAEVIQAICIEGWSVAEFAQYKGITPSAASHRLATARKRLKKIF